MSAPTLDELDVIRAEGEGMICEPRPRPIREADVEVSRTGAERMARSKQYNPNADKPVCQGGPRWYV